MEGEVGERERGGGEGGEWKGMQGGGKIYLTPQEIVLFSFWGMIFNSPDPDTF